MVHLWPGLQGAAAQQRVDKIFGRPVRVTSRHVAPEDRIGPSDGADHVRVVACEALPNTASSLYYYLNARVHWVNAPFKQDYAQRVLGEGRDYYWDDATLLHEWRSDHPVYLIVDGHPAHRAPAVKEYAASTGGRLKLFRLPGYSPELNPDEWVWKNVKHDRIGKVGVASKDDLKAQAVGALRRLQKMPRLVRAFFADPSLRYIAAVA